MDRELFGDDHEAYRDTVRKFLAKEVVPHYEQWEDAALIDRDVWRSAGDTGVLGLSVPEEYGGAAVLDYRFRYVVCEEVARSATTSFGVGISLHDDVAIPYIQDLGTDQQKQRWLPGMAAGTSIGAVAMTEPGAGSDLQAVATAAVAEGDRYVLNGSKTFITNGIHADVVVVVARTGQGTGSRALSLIVVEDGTPGFSKARKLRKVGLAGQDTAELVFSDVRVPRENLLGAAGDGFRQLMLHLPLERLSVAVTAMAGARAAYEWTLQYVFDRRAFGKPIGTFQNSRFKLAEMATELDITDAYVDRAVRAYNDGVLSAVDAAKAKWWATELQKRVVDTCLQLHGGYGYMLEYPIARAYRDNRIQTIYGGTTEIMKEIIGRDIEKTASRRS
ncbi:MAG: fadE [Nocardia sp.]|uniref:acyl-CoA dehydrogenase family protein n=1 Tax=Nocardia sp. TaxID=1821 RepID=UPI0026383C24|nr:acyl-CoA dehydrogenase family protein [Nocardia sp.]MCU1646123.1 fadE [Nocardia sp.]